MDAPLRRYYLQDVGKYYFEQFPWASSGRELQAMDQIIDLLVAAGAIPDPWLGEKGEIHEEYEGHRYHDAKAKMVETALANSEKQRLEAQALPNFRQTSANDTGICGGFKMPYRFRNLVGGAVAACTGALQRGFAIWRTMGSKI